MLDMAVRKTFKLLDQIGVEHLIKYNAFDKEQKHSYKSSDKNRKNWEYVTKLFCPSGWHEILLSHISRKKNTSGFVQVIHVYKPTNCQKLPQKSFNYNWHYEELKEQETTVFSPKDHRVFAQHKIDVEPVFWPDKG